MTYYVLGAITVLFIAVFVTNAISPNKPNVHFAYTVGRGWWAELNTIDGSHYNMWRGPYWFKWQAKNAFPIQRWTFSNPNK